MDNIFLSFLVTCKNEGDQLKSLLDLLYRYREHNECIILDDFSNDQITIQTIDYALNLDKKFFSHHKHSLNNDYGGHKNYGKSLCKGKYIFQIDADELPNEMLLLNIKEIVESNLDIELFWVPRINDFKGVNQQNAAQWGWRLTPYEDRLIVNWPDIQSRLFKNLPHIGWKRKLHEKVEGAKTYTHLPYEYEYALLHTKTIQKQIETNIRYNQLFTQEENKGFSI